MESLVKFEDIQGINSDVRRTLTPMFNDDFPAKQVKIADMKIDATLGGHYHHYRELFTVASGEAIFKIFNLDDPEKTIETFILTPGKRLFIPPKHPHEAKVKGGTILIGATEEKYTSPEENDIKYAFEDINKK